jgi:hypothetical protein
MLLLSTTSDIISKKSELACVCLLSVYNISYSHFLTQL